MILASFSALSFALLSSCFRNSFPLCCKRMSQATCWLVVVLISSRALAAGGRESGPSAAAAVTAACAHDRSYVRGGCL